MICTPLHLVIHHGVTPQAGRNVDAFKFMPWFQISQDPMSSYRTHCLHIMHALVRITWIKPTIRSASVFKRGSAGLQTIGKNKSGVKWIASQELQFGPSPTKQGAEVGQMGQRFRDSSSSLVLDWIATAKKKKQRRHKHSEIYLKTPTWVAECRGSIDWAP